MSGASPSSASASAAYSYQNGTNVVVKIPGPQILGWFLEFVPKDNSTPYQKMPDDFLPTSEMKADALPGTLAAVPGPMLAAAQEPAAGPVDDQHGDSP